jgi:tRNA dimethylallyltransferase
MSGRPGPVLAIVGPTAAGKSELALAVAARVGGEIVNADSMQLYQGMDIGTAKLGPAARRGIPHHLLDLWPVTWPADVASYQTAARSVIDGLLAAGRVPVVVGGSGLYVRAALDDLEFPGTDPDLRARLERELAERGAPALHAVLAERAPDAAAAILASNGRRIVRALEVVELTGGFRATLPGFRSVYDAVLIGVDHPELDARIAARAEAMWAAGFVEEVRGLLELGLARGRTASRALGYAQVIAYLDGTLDSAEAALADTTRATRRFARRQRSWFRRDPRIIWLDRPGPDAAMELLTRERDAARSRPTGSDR